MHIHPLNNVGFWVIATPFILGIVVNIARYAA